MPGYLVSMARTRTSPAAAGETVMLSCALEGWFVWDLREPTAVIVRAGVAAKTGVAEPAIANASAVPITVPVRRRPPMSMRSPSRRHAVPNPEGCTNPDG